MHFSFVLIPAWHELHVSVLLLKRDPSLVLLSALLDALGILLPYHNTLPSYRVF